MKLLLIIFLTISLTLTKNIEVLVPHCVFQQIVGTWTFQLTEPSQTREQVMTSCLPDTPITSVHETTIDLKLPNIAIDDKGNEGTWTMIIDTGLEIRINGMRLLNFFKWEKLHWYSKIISICNETWTWHFFVDDESSIPPTKWGCFNGVKTNDTVFKGWKKTFEYEDKRKNEKKVTPYGVGRELEDFRIIDQQKHWEFFQKYQKVDERVKDLPETFDWRKVNDTNYDIYIRDQGQCGSCYIFGVMGMLDDRVRIKTEMKQKPLYSEQDVINCAKPQGQGCSGGFPFLVSEFGHSYGLVSDDCIPYYAQDGKCKDEKCVKAYVKDYGYVGGYYGASNEENMMLEIYNNGPIAVSFYVTQDFFDYQWGIARCSSKLDPFNANHAVTIVGWGKGYWIVRNSWGQDWGQSGYFWMGKGKNTCNMEGAASMAIPIVTLEV